MDPIIVNLTYSAVVALEAQMTDREGQGVAVDGGVAEIAEHVEVPATRGQLRLLLVSSALFVDVQRGQLDDGKANEDYAHELEQLHVADDAEPKLCHRLLLNNLLHRQQLCRFLHKLCSGPHLSWEEILDRLELVFQELAVAFFFI